MPRLTIVKEFKAQRCEICHQADCYDPELNLCTRCSELNSSALVTRPATENRFPVQLPISNQVVIPQAVAIEDLGDTFTVIYRWYSAKRLGVTLAIGLSQFINMFVQLLTHHHTSTFWLTASVVIIYMLSIFALLLNKTYITIADNQIIKRSGPLALSFFSNRTIPIDNIQSIEYERRFRNDNIYLRLKNGKKMKLLGNNEDKETMQFIERILKERLNKKR